jgi:hypothetical protein
MSDYSEKKKMKMEFAKLREAFCLDVLSGEVPSGPTSEKKYIYDKVVENCQRTLALEEPTWAQRKQADLYISFIDKLTPKSINFLSGGKSPSLKIVLGHDDSELEV